MESGRNLIDVHIYKGPVLQLQQHIMPLHYYHKPYYKQNNTCTTHVQHMYNTWEHMTLAHKCINSVH